LVHEADQVVKVREARGVAGAWHRVAWEHQEGGSTIVCDVEAEVIEAGGTAAGAKRWAKD